MKMPLDDIKSTMFAPCGMNCMVCYKHCNHKKPCDGCLGNDTDKPEHCRKCKIKNCVNEKGHTYCYECMEYPCKKIKSLDKSYQTRYSSSLIKNSQHVKEYCIADFMTQQKKEFTCPQCGGIVSIHDSECSECHKKK